MELLRLELNKIEEESIKQTDKQKNLRNQIFFVIFVTNILIITSVNAEILLHSEITMATH